MSNVLTTAQLDEAMLLYSEHEWPVSDLCELFGVSNTAVINALKAAGVRMRTRYDPPKPLRMKQCANCLHFLPVGLFSWSGTRAKRRLQAWCNGCTAHPKPTAWITDPTPLTHAINHWRN